MKYLKVKQDIDPIERLEAISSRLSIESYSVTDFKQTFNSVIPAITSALEETSKKSKSLFKGFFASFVSNESLLRSIEKIDYSEIADIDVFVPEGFEGRMVSYLEVLLQSSIHANMVIDKVLLPYNAIISSYISNPESLKDNTNKHRWDSSLIKDIDNFNSKVGSFYKSTTSSTRKLSKTYLNTFDLRSSHVTLKNCINEIEKIKLDQLNKLIDEALEITKALQSVIKEADKLQASEMTIKFLADITLSLAKELEFYGINRHRVEVAQKCVQDTFDKLKKIV